MSVMSPAIHCWKAPVIAGHHNIAIIGSWVRQHAGSAREWQLSDSRLCHLRLATWKQKLEHDIVPAALDLSIRQYDSAHKCEIELKIMAPKIPPQFIADILPKITETLDRHPHAQAVLAVFQQADPEKK
tara:strand:- start:554 stop:940 length:387 start_codon:yes stop_codon:yes gene_type:complete